MQVLDGYTLTGILAEDGGLVLARGLCKAVGAPVLLRAARRDDAAGRGMLEREFALRGELDAAWAALPLALLGEGDAGAGTGSGARSGAGSETGPATSSGTASAKGPCPALVYDDPGMGPLALRPGAPLAQADFLRVGAAIASAVAQMHRRLIIHQNLKPAHILVDLADPPCRSALLTGFGMAERIGRVQDTREDLYSLGVILHQMLTGTLPFAAAGAEWGGVQLSHATRAGAAAPTWAGIDPTCKALVHKLLAGAAGQRYQSAAGVYADLQHCRSMFEAQGRVEPFVLGCHDGAARVRMPQRLIGRDAELALLAGALRDARHAAGPELLLISGHPGTGKTALMAALPPLAAAAGATVIHGRFDPLQRDIPYAALAHAFRGMVRQRLAQGEASLAAWRLKLMSALGRNARLMLELIPELKFVIGEHAPPPPLAPAEAQCRFETVFRQFVAVCCGPDAVLLVCLDELQAIDPASLHLLGNLLTHPGVRNVLVVGACRSGAAGGGHPAMAAVPAVAAAESLRAQGARMRTLDLQALDQAHTCALVAAALGSGPEPVAALAALVFPKTAGNPYFTLQFLTRVGEAGLLHYNTAHSRWDWDAAAIGAREFADNVVDLMLARLQQMPAATRELVTLLACLGTEAELETIALVSGMSLLETDECLWPAARMGLLRREQGAYRFVHDRVRASAYGLMAAASLPERHLHIGRLLLAAAASDACGEGQARDAGDAGDEGGDGDQASEGGAVHKQLFGIVHHFNLALAAIGDAGELRRLCSLNVRAGAKAYAAIAYESARGYYSLAAGLRPASAWQDDFEANFTLYAALAECEYLCGNAARATRLFTLLTEQARTRAEVARVALMRIALYQVSGRFEQAAAAAFEALALFGMNFPCDAAGIAQALADERAAIAVNMGGRSVAALIDQPASVDPDAAIVCELLADMGSSVFSARPALYPLLAARALNYTLRHGSTPTSCITYSRYAIVLVALGAVDDAFQYSDLALRLARRQADGVAGDEVSEEVHAEVREGGPGGPQGVGQGVGHGVGHGSSRAPRQGAAAAWRRAGRLRFVHGAYIHPWREPLAGSVVELEQAFLACQEAGDLPHAGYAAHIATWNRFEAGAPLDAVVRAAQAHQEFARRQRNEPLLQLLRCYEQLARCLQGRTAFPGSLDEPGFCGAEAAGVFARAGYGAAEVRFQLAQQIAAFSFGRYHDALRAAEAASAQQHFFLASVNEATHHFYHALTMAALYHEAPPRRQAYFRGALREKQEKLRAWAACCPHNFDNRYLLVSAELARLQGDDCDALRAYEGAIASAQAGGFVQNEALACELAARFCRSRGQDAQPYAHRALAAWRAWGAEGKARHLLAAGAQPGKLAQPGSLDGPGKAHTY